MANDEVHVFMDGDGVTFPIEILHDDVVAALGGCIESRGGTVGGVRPELFFGAKGDDANGNGLVPRRVGLGTYEAADLFEIKYGLAAFLFSGVGKDFEVGCDQVDPFVGGEGGEGDGEKDWPQQELWCQAHGNCHNTAKMAAQKAGSIGYF